MIYAAYALLALLQAAIAAAVLMEGPGLGLDQTVRSFLSSVIPGQTPGILLYFLTLAGLFFCYAKILRTPPTRKALNLGALLAVAFSFTTPTRSSDVFAYLAHGYHGSQNLSQAHSTPVREGEAPYVDDLAGVNGLPAHGPTPYGPLWTFLEISAVKIAGENILLSMLFLKAVTALCFLGSALVIARISGTLAGGTGLAAAQAFLFNPLLLLELVAEAHNDSVIVFLSLLALLLLVRSRIGLAVFTLGVAVLTKYVPAILGAPALAYVVQNKRPWIKASAIAVAALAALATALYFPLWAGVDTFRGVRDNSDGIPAVLRPWLTSFFKSLPPALTTLRLAMLAGFAFFAWRISRSTKEAAQLPRSAACLLLAYFLFFPAYVWSWYLTLPIALLLIGKKRDLKLAFFLSVVGAVNSPLWSFGKTRWLEVPTVQLLHHLTVPTLAIAGFLFYLWRRPAT